MQGTLGRPTWKSSSVRELTSCRLMVLRLVEVRSCLSIPSVMLPHLHASLLPSIYKLLMNVCLKPMSRLKLHFFYLKVPGIEDVELLKVSENFLSLVLGPANSGSISPWVSVIGVSVWQVEDLFWARVPRRHSPAAVQIPLA